VVDLVCVAGPVWWSSQSSTFQLRGEFLDSWAPEILRVFAKIAAATDTESIVGTTTIESFGDDGIRVAMATPDGRCYTTAEFVLVDVERGIWSVRTSPVLVNALVAWRKQYEVQHAA
jgi:hypothetical protein